MPGMPVMATDVILSAAKDLGFSVCMKAKILRLWLRMTTLFFCVAAAGVSAQAAVAVRSIEDLRTDKNLLALEQQFITFTNAAVLYDKCAAAYGITPDQQFYVTQTYATLGQQYTQSYYDVYVAKVGAPPEQKVVDYYTKFIADEQQSNATNMRAFIEKQGCGKSLLRNLYKSIETTRRTEEARKAKPADPWSQK